MAKIVNEIIVSALKPFGLPVVERLYEGRDDEYFYFLYADDTAEDFGDDKPEAYVSYMQIHYICPWSKSYTECNNMKKNVRKALIKAGFTAPEFTDASDDTARIRHYVFECDIENEYELED